MKKGVTTVAGHGANFADRFAAGVTSRFRAAVKRHEPFDRNVAIPVVRTKGVTYKFVNVSGNDYMWEIKGWNSNEPEKSFLVPTGWILQMPYKGEEPYLLIPPSEWNKEYNLSEVNDPHLNVRDYDKKVIADQMGTMYPIFKQEPIANFDEYLFSQTIGGDEDPINTWALRLPFSYWGTHLPVPESMPEGKAKETRKQAKEAATWFATTGNYLAAVSRHKPFDRNEDLPLLITNGVRYNLKTTFYGTYPDYMWEIKGWNSTKPEKSFLVPTGWILQMPTKGIEPYLLIPPSEWNKEYNLSYGQDPYLNGKVSDKKDLAKYMAAMYPIFGNEPIANFDEYLFKQTIMGDVHINIHALRLPGRYWGTHLPVPKSIPEEEAKQIRKQAAEAANYIRVK